MRRDTCGALPRGSFGFEFICDDTDIGLIPRVTGGLDLLLGRVEFWCPNPTSCGVPS